MRLQIQRFAFSKRLIGLFILPALLFVACAHQTQGEIYKGRFAWMKYKLGIATSPIVILGKKGWVFTKGGQEDLDDYRGLANPGDKVDRLKDDLAQRNETVRSLGGRFLYAIPPVNETTYNELLPREYRKVGNRRRATLALEKMQGSGIDMLYLANALTEAKPRGQVFYKYDSHWNRFGAYIGSLAVISHLSHYYPALKGSLERISDYELVTGPPGTTMWPNGRNFGYYLGLTMLEPDPEPVPKSGWTTKMETKQFAKYGADVFTKDDPSLPTLVMFGDSFMYGMRRVMAENFRRAVFVNPWYVG